jgi:Predicted membrane protein
LYCQKCGKEINDNSTFCSSCGASTDGSTQTNNIPNYGPQNNAYVYSREKSNGVGIILGFFIPGLGHLYAGKIGKGLLIMFSGIILSVISMIAVFGAISYDSTGALNGALTFLIILPIIYIIIWIWNMYDVNKVIKEYNECLRRTGNPPW